MKPLKGRLFLAAMLLVTAWSLWAFAQNKGHEHDAKHGSLAAPMHMHPAPPSTAAMPTIGPSPAARTVIAQDGTSPASPGRGRDLDQKKAEEAEGEEPPPINWTDFGSATPPFIAMVVNFGILVAGYYLLGKRPVMAALEGRRDSIAKEIEQAAHMKQEAEERARVYQGKLARLEEEMLVAREGLVRAGEAERDRIVAEAEAKAERMRKDAEFLAAQEMKQVRQDLLRDTVEAAVQAAAEMLAKRVTPADQDRLAEDYLADLAGRKGTASTAPAARPSNPPAGGRPS